MKLPAILILLTASALPVPLAAQTAGSPLIGTNWSLKELPRKARTARPAPPVAANRQGPAVPAPIRSKTPRQRTAAKAPAPARAKRVNGAPILGAIARDTNRPH